MTADKWPGEGNFLLNNLTAKVNSTIFLCKEWGILGFGSFGWAWMKLAGVRVSKINGVELTWIFHPLVANQQSNCELRGFAQYIAVSLMHISVCTHLLYGAMQNESTELCSISHVCSLYFPWKVYCSVYIAVKPVEVLLSGNLYILPAGGCGLEAIRSTHQWYFN